MRQPCVVFAIPSRDHAPKLAFATSMLATNTLLNQHGIDQVWLTTGGDPYLSKVRNSLASKALANYPRMTHFFFLDDDVSFPAEAALALIRSPFDVRAGIYPKKCDPPAFPCELVIDPGTLRPIVRDGFVRAHAVPTGFLCIAADVLRAQAETAPRYRDLDGSVCWNIFEMGFHAEPQPDSLDGQWWGEDYAWCRKHREAGGEIWVKPDIEFGHTGTKTWKGNFADSVRLTLEGIQAWSADGAMGFFPAASDVPAGWSTERPTLAQAAD